MPLFIIMLDYECTMRSKHDTLVRKLFFSKESAQKYIDDRTIKSKSGTIYCGAYSAEIKKVSFNKLLIW